MSVQAQAEKAKVVDQIISEVDQASVVVFTDFRGLSVTQLTKLRRTLKSEGAKVAVYKNTLTRRALDALNIAYPESFLEGPSAIVHTSGDAVKMTKMLVDFAKEAEKLTIKGGLLNKGILDEGSVKALAQLPGREELLAKVVGSLKSPLSRLVATLSSPSRGLVYALAAIKDKK